MSLEGAERERALKRSMIAALAELLLVQSPSAAAASLTKDAETVRICTFAASHLAAVARALGARAMIIDESLARGVPLETIRAATEHWEESNPFRHIPNLPVTKGQARVAAQSILVSEAVTVRRVEALPLEVTSAGELLAVPRDARPGRTLPGGSIAGAGIVENLLAAARLHLDCGRHLLLTAELLSGVEKERSEAS